MRGHEMRIIKDWTIENKIKTNELQQIISDKIE